MTKKLLIRILLKPYIVLILVALMLVVLALPVMAGESSVGVGWGIAYGGGPGMNLDFSIIPDVLDLSLGLASLNDDEYEYSKQLYYTVGGKCYFRPATTNFRPRLSFYYGYTGETEWTHIGDKLTYYHDYMGVMVGCGFVVYFGKTHRHGLELDFPIFILSRDKTPIINSGNLSSSLGYKYRFN